MKAWRWPLLVGAATFLFGVACATLIGPTPTPIPLPTPETVNQQLRIFESIWSAVNEQYVRADFDGVDWEAVGEIYRAQVEAGLDEASFVETMHAMLAELPDGKASYQTRAERLEAEITDASQYQGIGAFIAFRAEPEPHVVILAVIRGSPAERAGLKSHDSIYAIDGRPVLATEADTVAERIRGPADTTVTLTVQGPDGRRRDLSIPRGQITATDVLRGGIISSLNVAYYRVPVVADAELATTIADNLSSQDEATGLKGVILDLRVAHSGGQGWPLGEMLSLFGDGVLGEFYTRTLTETLTVQGQDLSGSQTVPIVILIGPDTEGTPEIFAAALQGAQRAMLVGLPTRGLVDGFSEIPLADGSRMFLATSSFRTLDGVDLAKSGLVPDIRVGEDWDQISDDNDTAIAAALALLNR